MKVAVHCLCHIMKYAIRYDMLQIIKCSRYDFHCKTTFFDISDISKIYYEEKKIAG